jgi:hypothetical protein
MRIHTVALASIPLVAALVVPGGCGGGATDIAFQPDEDAGPDGHGGSAGAGASGGDGPGASGGVGAEGGVGGDAGFGGSIGGDAGFGGTSAGGFGGSSGGGFGGVGGDAGGTFACGGQPCPPAPGGFAQPCCTFGDECGVQIGFLGGECQPFDQPGVLDPDCPDLNLMGFNLDGCCRSDGICGVMDTFLGLGCVDPSSFGQPPGPPCGGGVGGAGGVGGSAGAGGGGGTGATDPGQKNCGITSPDVCTDTEKCCVLDPGQDYCAGASDQCQCNGPNCSTTDVTCDGHEDCAGQVCCGVFSFQQQQYVTLECRADCNAPNLREICKPGDGCADPGQSCGQSQFLPSYLWRCN